MAHTRWNIRTHLVWIVKYRKNLLLWPGVSEYFCELVRGIGERYRWVIDTMATDSVFRTRINPSCIMLYLLKMITVSRLRLGPW